MLVLVLRRFCERLTALMGTRRYVFIVLLLLMVLLRTDRSSWLNRIFASKSTLSELTAYLLAWCQLALRAGACLRMRLVLTVRLGVELMLSDVLF